MSEFAKPPPRPISGHKITTWNQDQVKMQAYSLRHRHRHHNPWLITRWISTAHIYTQWASFSVNVSGPTGCSKKLSRATKRLFLPVGKQLNKSKTCHSFFEPANIYINKKNLMYCC